MSDQSPAPEPFDSLLDTFLELHGDRTETDVSHLRGGLARMGNKRFVLIGIPPDCSDCHTPAAYRKVVRLTQLAAQLRRPLVILGADAILDTPRERLAETTAFHELMQHLLKVAVPVIALVGATSFPLADRVIRWRPEMSPPDLRTRLEAALEQCSQLSAQTLLVQRFEAAQQLAGDSPAEEPKTKPLDNPPGQ